MKRPVWAHILALLAAFLAIVAVSALWILNLRIGPPLGGWVAGPMIIYIPAVLLIMTGLWLIVRAIVHGRMHWRALTVGLFAFVLSFVTVVVTCGPIACFMPGPDRLLGWFVVGGVTVIALVHHLVLNKATPAA